MMRRVLPSLRAPGNRLNARPRHDRAPSLRGTDLPTTLFVNEAPNSEVEAYEGARPATGKRRLRQSAPVGPVVQPRACVHPAEGAEEADSGRHSWQESSTGTAPRSCGSRARRRRTWRLSRSRIVVLGAPANPSPTRHVPPTPQRSKSTADAVLSDSHPLLRLTSRLRMSW